LPDSICNIIKLYDEETAINLFEVVCAENVSMSNKDFAISFLTDVYNTTMDICHEKLYNILDGSSLNNKKILMDEMREKNHKKFFEKYSQLNGN
jgi:hypothetical protein